MNARNGGSGFPLAYCFVLDTDSAQNIRSSSRNSVPLHSVAFRAWMLCIGLQ